jgi:hypothetical protein
MFFIDFTLRKSLGSLADLIHVVYQCNLFAKNKRIHFVEMDQVGGKHGNKSGVFPYCYFSGNLKLYDTYGRQRQEDRIARQYVFVRRVYNAICRS